MEELPDLTFPLSLKLIDRYQQEDPFLTEKLISLEYNRIIFAEAGII